MRIIRTIKMLIIIVIHSEIARVIQANKAKTSAYSATLQTIDSSQNNPCVHAPRFQSNAAEATAIIIGRAIPIRTIPMIDNTATKIAAMLPARGVAFVHAVASTMLRHTSGSTMYCPIRTVSTQYASPATAPNAIVRPHVYQVLETTCWSSMITFAIAFHSFLHR